MACLDDDSATALFKQMRLSPEALEELDKKMVERGEEPKHVDGPAVMDASQLRPAFAELGDTVEGAGLFALVQLADPDGDGVMPLERFLEVVKVRREQIEKARQEKQLVDAYVALGGSEDREKRVASDALLAITKDFVGDEAAAAALAAVVKHKYKAVQEVLDMGGELDEEEEEELKDTRKLTWEEVQAYAQGLFGLGPPEPGVDDEPLR